MARITVTDYNDCALNIATDGIIVQEQPRGQTQIVLPSGVVYQVKESVEEVTSMLKEVEESK